MAFSDRNLEEKIASVKFALKELGNSLENDDKFSQNERFLPQVIEIEKGPKRALRVPETQDLKFLLDSEREKNSLLEVRISHKDELLFEMTSLQNELYANIEELQNKVNALKSDLEYSQVKISDGSKEIENLSKILQQREIELNKLASERDDFMDICCHKEEESRLLTQELLQKDPEKGLTSALVIYI